jgi:hypothetical protein
MNNFPTMYFSEKSFTSQPIILFLMNESQQQANKHFPLKIRKMLQMWYRTNAKGLYCYPTQEEKVELGNFFK